MPSVNTWMSSHRGSGTSGCASPITMNTTIQTMTGLDARRCQACGLHFFGMALT